MLLHLHRLYIASIGMAEGKPWIYIASIGMTEGKPRIYTSFRLAYVPAGIRTGNCRKQNSAIQSTDMFGFELGNRTVYFFLLYWLVANWLRSSHGSFEMNSEAHLFEYVTYRILSKLNACVYNHFCGTIVIQNNSSITSYLFRQISQLKR
jgi:hypothetical protein